MKTALLLAPLALLGACATISAAPSGPPRPEGSAVALGEPVAVGNLVATPLRVTEDSRCPINARCVRAGELVVSTRLDGDGWRETVPLTLGETYATHGTRVALVSGEPGRMAGGAETEPEDYRFTFDGGD